MERRDSTGNGGGDTNAVVAGVVTGVQGKNGGTVPNGATDSGAASATSSATATAPPAGVKTRSPDRGCETCRVVIIDERSFRRESVLRLLREVSPDCRFVALARPCELAAAVAAGGSDAADAGDVDVVALDIGWTRLPDERVEDDIRSIKDVLGDVPIILLSDREDSAHVAQALHCGVRGFIPTSLCTAVVVEAIRLVTAGGTFIPASALVHALTGPRDCRGEHQRTYDRCAQTAALTPREAEVLDLLRRGKPNKIIAAELDLKETTVKIHVRHIMKKLKATNRTEAALMAERAR